MVIKNFLHCPSEFELEHLSFGFAVVQEEQQEELLFSGNNVSNPVKLKILISIK